MSALTGLSVGLTAKAAQIDLLGPPGSSAFGTEVAVLPNGNFVVTDPSAASNVGAVYLFSPSGAMISSFTGSVAGDFVGGYSGGGTITVLKNGNFVIVSPAWHNNMGAVTLVNGSTGLTGAVSSTNSLVGSTANDQVGRDGIVLLNGSNFVLSSPFWNNGGTVPFAGAVTWVNGDVGSVGSVSAPRANVT